MNDRRATRDMRTPAADRLAALRSRRTWDARAKPIAEALAPFRGQLERRQRTAGPAQNAWAKVLPTELVEASTVLSLARGTLTVRIPDSATRFATDRFLRAGGEMAVIRACPTTVRRIKLVP
ncbi:MAG: hypothetical protein AAGB48_07835 [Planctomycetota bacterium]